MKIWLDQVQEEPFSWDETESIAAEALDRPELLALSPVAWQGEVVYTDPGYLLRGRLSYDQTLACIRCLKPHAARASVDVELLVMVELPAKTPAGSGHRAKGRKTQPPGRALEQEDDGQELQEGDINTLVVADEVLDTRPLLLEQLQLNIPMKPLCRPDCAGLCPRCGADRNELPGGECSCAPPEADPRWAALVALKGQLEPDQGS